MASVIITPWGVRAPAPTPKDCAYRGIINMKLNSSKVHIIMRLSLNLEKRARSILEGCSQKSGNVSHNTTYVILLWVRAYNILT